MIAALQFAFKGRNQSIDVVRYRSSRTKTCDRSGDIPFHVRALVKPSPIGGFERLSQCSAMRAELHRIRTRLEYRDDARLAHFATQSIERGGNSGWMMREVVVNGNTARDTAHFHSTPHAFELRERFDRDDFAHAGMSRSNDCSQGVFDVVTTQHRPFDFPDYFPAMNDFETRSIAPVRHARMPINVTRSIVCKSGDRRPASHFQRCFEVGIRAVAHHTTITRDHS